MKSGYVSMLSNDRDYSDMQAHEVVSVTEETESRNYSHNGQNAIGGPISK